MSSQEKVKKIIFLMSILSLIHICSNNIMSLKEDDIVIEEGNDFIDDGLSPLYHDLKIKERYLQGAYSHNIKIRNN